MIDIGEYIGDKRLGGHDETYASFHGEGCDDGVRVDQTEGGVFVTQRTYTDPEDDEIKHTVGDEYPTAAAALFAAIGPVMPAETPK